MSDLFINKKVWGLFSEVEMNEYLASVFAHFRDCGFPYFPTSVWWRDKEFRKCISYDHAKCVLEDEKEIKQTMHGLSLCWSYHPHHYEVACNDKMTVKAAFDDDAILKKVIARRIKMGDNMSDNGLKKMLKIFSGVQCVSNFRPTAAAAIYSRFCPSGGAVYDMSSGYGGRVLGAHIAGVSYKGVEPCKKTHDGLMAMVSDFGIDAEIRNQGSEIGGWVDDKSVDLCFTSPPYFDCEKYSDEDTQSYIKYPTKERWLNGFIKETILECIRVVKDDGVIALNIQNVPSYKTLVDDVCRLMAEIGLVLIDTWGLQLSRLGKGGIKTEPILIFKTKGIAK